MELEPAWGFTKSGHIGRCKNFQNYSATSKSQRKNTKDQDKSDCASVNFIQRIENNTVQISVNKTKTFALIDTGAIISRVSQSINNKTDFSNSKLESPDFLFIKGLTGQKLKVFSSFFL